MSNQKGGEFDDTIITNTHSHFDALAPIITNYQHQKQKCIICVNSLFLSIARLQQQFEGIGIKCILIKEKKQTYFSQNLKKKIYLSDAAWMGQWLGQQMNGWDNRSKHNVKAMVVLQPTCNMGPLFQYAQNMRKIAILDRFINKDDDWMKLIKSPNMIKCNRATTQTINIRCNLPNLETVISEVLGQQIQQMHDGDRIVVISKENIYDLIKQHISLHCVDCIQVYCSEHLLSKKKLLSSEFGCSRFCQRDDQLPKECKTHPMTRQYPPDNTSSKILLTSPVAIKFIPVALKFITKIIEINTESIQSHDQYRITCPEIIRINTLNTESTQNECYAKKKMKSNDNYAKEDEKNETKEDDINDVKILNKKIKEFVGKHKSYIVNAKRSATHIPYFKHLAILFYCQQGMGGKSTSGAPRQKVIQDLQNRIKNHVR
eukprot:296910_1